MASAEQSDEMRNDGAVDLVQEVLASGMDSDVEEHDGWTWGEDTADACCDAEPAPVGGEGARWRYVTFNANSKYFQAGLHRFFSPNPTHFARQAPQFKFNPIDDDLLRRVKEETAEVLKRVRNSLAKPEDAKLSIMEMFVACCPAEFFQLFEVDSQGNSKAVWPRRDRRVSSHRVAHAQAEIIGESVL